MDINLNRINSLTPNTVTHDKTDYSSGTSNAVCADYKSIYNSHSDTKKLNMAFKANAMAQVPVGYREVQTFDVPFLDKGKLYQLDNGQKVVIIPKQGPTTINTYVKVGSFNEPEKIKGISHYIEHNLFNGSSQLKPGEFVELTNNMGAEYNAGTETLTTNYYIASPLHKSSDLEKFISMHADMLQSPSFLQDMLDKEKGPVISEIHMYNDMPGSRSGNDLIKNLFNIKSDKDLIAGSEQTIADVTKQDVLDFYNKWYTPDNMTTVIVGDVNPNEAIKYVSKHFNTGKNNTNPVEKYYLPLNNSIQKTKRVDYKSSGVNTVDLEMAFVGPKNNDIKETVASNALSIALSGYENARLTKALKSFNTSAGIGVRTISPDVNDPQVVQLYANFKPGDEENGLKAIYSVLYDITQKPITEPELNIIKSKMKNGLASASESSMALSNIVGSSMVNNGDLRLYTELPKIIDSLTVTDIQNAARKYLDLNKTSIVMLHPQSQQIVAHPAQKISFGSKCLSFKGSLDRMKMEYVKEYDLSNNLHLVVNNDPGSIKTTSVLSLQTDNFPPSKPGVSEILTLMMNEGTKKYTNEQLSEINDSNDLNVSVSAGNKSLSASTNCNNEKLPLSLEMMKEMLYNPDFTQEKFEKAKEEIKINYMSAFDNPKDRAYEALYGDNPHGYSPRKVLENIDQVSMQDVISLYTFIMQNAQATAVITGSLDKIPNLQNQIFNSLGSGIPVVQKYHYNNTFVSEPLAQNRVITEVKDRDQAHIVQMFKIKESGNIKDNVTLSLLNKILGGSSQSRLFRDLRESQKLAYMVKSRYSSDGETGELGLEIKTTTRNSSNGQIIPQYENLQKSIDGFKNHVTELIKTPVEQKELEGAKLAIKSEIMNNLESSAGKTGMLLSGLNSYYGKDETNELLKTVDTITPEDIQKAVSLYLKQPSVISIIASKDTIENKKDYLASLGSLTQY
ncbi:MAG: pitrilysin family protein [Candidatus Gastranaerophilales bacterium]|nr:pitrilysin family protein [Candidatus Gastranaerophilales bacterium]